MTVISGSNAYIHYGWEDVAYGTEAASFNKVFGHIQGYNLNQSNSTIKVFAVGDNEAKTSVAGKYEGTIDIDFIPTDFYFLKGVFGTVLTAGAGPYTHTYPDNTDEATRTASLKTFKSASVQVGLNLATDSVITALGGIFDSFSLTATQGEVINCKLTIPFQTVAEDATLHTAATTAEAPFTFANATLEIPNATAISNVESVEITVNRNREPVFAIGSRINQAAVPKQSEYEIKVTVPYEAAATLMESFWGSVTGPSITSVSEVATAELTIDNGGTTTASRKIVFLISGLMIDNNSLTVSQNEIVKEDVTLLGRTITSAIYTNNTATAL